MRPLDGYTRNGYRGAANGRKGAAPNQTVQPPSPSSDEIPPVESGLLNMMFWSVILGCQVAGAREVELPSE